MLYIRRTNPARQKNWSYKRNSMLKKIDDPVGFFLFILFSRIIAASVDAVTDTIKANYLALKKVILSDPGKDDADIFNEDIGNR